MAQSQKSGGSSKSKGSNATPETNKQVAVTGGAANLPAFMQGDAQAGKENISQQDMVTPRVALMQAVSPEVVEGKAENGHLYHTISEEDLGETLDMVIVHHSKRYTLWNPRHAGGGVLARASDGKVWDTDASGTIAPYKDRPKHMVPFSVKKGEPVGRDVGLGRWGTMDPENEDSPPMATLTHVLVGIAPDRLDIGPFVVLLQRSAEPVAKMLLSKIRIDAAPIYGQVYTMSSRIAPSASGDFNQYTFVKNGHVADEQLYLFLQEQNRVFTDLGVKIDEAAAQADAEVDTGDGDGGDDKGGKGGKGGRNDY